MNIVVNGIVAALLAVWTLPFLSGGFAIPSVYGWTAALVFVLADMSFVSLQLVRVEARRRSR